jgi:hypothetical protein
MFCDALLVMYQEIAQCEQIIAETLMKVIRVVGLTQVKRQPFLSDTGDFHSCSATFNYECLHYRGSII